MPTLKVKGQVRINTPNGLATKYDTLEVPVDWALVRLGDSNLTFVFGENDIEELKQVNPERFARLNKIHGFKIETHNDLILQLIPEYKSPKKSSPKKTTTKKSSLSKTTKSTASKK